MKTFATIFLTASMTLGSALVISTPASAVPGARFEIAPVSDVIQVRQDGKPAGWNGHGRHDDWYWRHHRHYDRHDWHRDRWDHHHDRYWDQGGYRDRYWDQHYRRHSGVTIEF